MDTERQVYNIFKTRTTVTIAKRRDFNTNTHLHLSFKRGLWLDLSEHSAPHPAGIKAHISEDPSSIHVIK